jgi:hypothetical protein
MNAVAKALSVATGGNITDYVPAPLAAEVIAYVREVNIMRGLITEFKQNSRTWKMPKNASALSAYYVPDGVTAPMSQYTTGSVTWTAKKMMSFTTIDEEAIEDSIVDVVDQVFQQFGEAIGESEELAILTGDPDHAASAPTPDSATTANWYVFDPRLIFEGLVPVALGADAATQVDANGGSFDTELVNEAIYNLGKYGRNKAGLIAIAPAEQAANIRANSKFQDASATGLALASFIAGMGSAGEGVGEMRGLITDVYGIKVYEAPQSTAGTMVVYMKKSPLLGDRRLIKFKSGEIIESDQRKYVVSERVSFNYKWRDALCAITDLDTSIVS